MPDISHRDLLGLDLHAPYHFIQPTDPGAVGAGLFWLDTSVLPLRPSRRNQANTGWDPIAAGSSFRTVSTASSVVPNDEVIAINSTSAPVTVTLPAVNTFQPGTRFSFIKIDPTAHPAILAATGSDKIVGLSTFSLTYQYGALDVVGDGISNWLMDPPQTNRGALEIVIDGGGQALGPGVKADIELAWGLDLTAVRMVPDQAAGGIVVDLLTAPFANFPGSAVSICPTTPPTLTGQPRLEDTTLSGWTTTLVQGNWLRVNVVSVSILQRVTLSLSGFRTS
jgi:hypothetical protein